MVCIHSLLGVVVGLQGRVLAGVLTNSRVVMAGLYGRVVLMVFSPISGCASSFCYGGIIYDSRHHLYTILQGWKIVSLKRVVFSRNTSEEISVQLLCTTHSLQNTCVTLCY